MLDFPVHIKRTIDTRQPSRAENAIIYSAAGRAALKNFAPNVKSTKGPEPTVVQKSWRSMSNPCEWYSAYAGHIITA